MELALFGAREDVMGNGAETVANAGTIGDEMWASGAISEAADRLVAEASSYNERIADVRPASPELAESFDELLFRAGETRGRGKLYPYLGSGAGNGALVELRDGSVKWDMITGIGVHYFGHGDPDLMREGVLGSIGDTVKHGNLQANWESYAFAETLLGEAKKHSGLRHCFLSTSGAMANESALKLCLQKHAPACRVIAFADCFMGRSIVMSQIGDSAGNRVGIPLSQHVDYMPFWDPDAAAQMGKARYIDMAVAHLVQYLDRYPGQHACFIFELIQGEGGFNVGDRDFFKALIDVCKDRGVAVWDDEIQTFGRTDRMFAYEHFDLGEYVDVFCVGKMTQVCATLFTEDYNPAPGLLSGTFTGETPTFRVGRRIVERLRDGNYYGPDGSNARHQRAFREQVGALMKKHPAWFPAVDGLGELCGGIGGMMRMTPFGGEKAKIAALSKILFEEGVIVFWCGHSPYHVRMLPPLGVMNESDWPRVFEVVERGMARAAKELGVG